jgi:hypothetical protein
MTTDLDRLRGEIRSLAEKHARGDIRDKEFEPALAERTVGLYRALVQRRLDQGESILAEHHVVFSHTRLTESMLREPEQTAVSFFATDKRLWRVRSPLRAGLPPLADDTGGARLDSTSYDRIESLETRRRVRSGEVGVGLGLIAVAAAFQNWLSVTGPLLMLLGALGVLHGLLLPTRWIEVRIRGAPPEEPMAVYALRKKSGRRLLKVVREKARVR